MKELKDFLNHEIDALKTTSVFHLTVEIETIKKRIEEDSAQLLLAQEQLSQATKSIEQLESVVKSLDAEP